MGFLSPLPLHSKTTRAFSQSVWSVCLRPHHSHKKRGDEGSMPAVCENGSKVNMLSKVKAVR